MSPVLEGRFLTTGPPGKPLVGEFNKGFSVCYDVLQANRGDKDRMNAVLGETEHARLALRRGRPATIGT